jgi:hypothetical protein
MIQILDKHNELMDVFEQDSSNIFLFKVQCTRYMSDWFKKQLKKAFPRFVANGVYEINTAEMARITDVYLFTR